MPLHHYSTGLPKLDHFIGELQPGDSLLLFVPRLHHSTAVIEQAINHAIISKTPIVYLSVDDSHLESLSNAQKLKYRKFTEKDGNPISLLRSVKRYASANVKNSYVIIDDLTKWIGILGNQARVAELFSFLVASVQKGKCFLIASALRSVFGKSTLIMLKDEATICLDLIIHQNQTYCIPLTSKGKFILQGILPFRFELDQLAKPLSKVSESSVSSLPELSEKESKQIESLLASFDDKYEKMFQGAGEAMMIFDIAGDYRELNNAAAVLLGYSADELKMISPVTIISPNQRFKFFRFISELKRRKRGSIVLDIKTKDRKSIAIEFRASNIGGGFYFGTMKDVSETKRSEKIQRQKEAEYKLLLETIPQNIAVIHENNILFVNPAFIRSFGYEAGYDLSKIKPKQLFTQESYRRYQKFIKEKSTGAELTIIELRCVRKDGTEFETQVTISAIPYRGKTCLQVTIMDITATKIMIDRLTSSEKQFKMLIDNAVSPVSLIRDGVFVYVNRALSEMFGYESNEKILNKEITATVAEEDRERISESLKKHVSKGSKQTVINYDGIRSDGKDLFCELVILTADGNKSGELLGFFRDKTEDRRLTGELQQRYDEMKLLEIVMPVFSGTFDVHKLLSTVLNKLTDTLSWGIGGIYLADEKTKELQLKNQKNYPDVLNKKLSSLSHEEGIGGFISKTLSPQHFRIEKFPSYLPFRSLFKEAGITQVGFIPLVSHEKLVGIILLATKHSDAKVKYSHELFAIIGENLGNAVTNAKAFRQIAESENNKRALIETSPVILYQSTPAGAFISVNSSIEKIVGYSSKDFLKNGSLWLKLIHPDDKKIFLERIANLQQHSLQTTDEYRCLPKGKASYRWVRDSLTSLKDQEGTVQSVLGTIIDITDEKLLLDSLQSENVFKTNLLSSINEGIVVFDRNMRCLKWNSTMETITGMSVENAVGKTASEVLPFYAEHNMDNLLRHALDGKMVNSDDIPYTISDTKLQGYISGRYYPLRMEDGQIDGVVGIFSDISQRKNAENEIREFEHILSNVIDTMGDILILTDLRGKVLQVNKAFLQILGYPRKNVTGCEFPYPWQLDEEMGRFVLWISTLREHNWLHDFDMTMRAQDGHLIPVSLSTTLLRNQLGEPIAMLNIARDITERKRLMKTLESRNKQIEMINRIVTIANQTLDFREVFEVLVKEINKIVPSQDINVGLLTTDGTGLLVYANKGSRSLYEGKIVDLAQTISKHSIKSGKPVIVSDYLTESNYAELLTNKEGIRSQISLPITLKGKIFGTLNIGCKEPHMFSDEHTAILLPIAQQIGAVIDRVRLFNQVSEDSVYIHNLLDSIDSVVYTMDRDNRIREVNKAWYVFMQEFGVKNYEDYHGRYLYDVLPSEPLKVTFQKVIDPLLGGSIRIFSQQFVHETGAKKKIYQLTINPMVIDRKITGLVFTHTDITALKRTEADLKKSNEQLLALNEISALISSSRDISKMLQSAVSLLKKIIEPTAVIVYLQEIGSTDLVLAYQLGFDPVEFSSILRLKQTGSMTGEVVELKRSMFIQEKAYLDERIMQENRAVLRHAKIEAMAVIPLVSNDKVFGALDIFYNYAHEFTDQEQQLLALVGNQLGAAIENAQLYNELSSQIERLTVLYSLSEQLTSTLNIDQIFEAVYEHVKRVLPFQSFIIDLYNEKLKTKTPVFHVEAFKGEEVFVSKMSQPILISPGSPQENVILTKHTFQANDRKSIFIPMLSKESLIGIMSVEASEQEVYTDTQLKLLESVANLSAIALEKGNLYEETLQKSIEIQRRNKELDDFTYVVSHDLKEPLISVEGFSRILQMDYKEIIQAEGREYLDSIVGATTRMKGLIDDLLLLSRISRPSESFKNVSVKDIIQEIQTDMEFTIRQKGVNFKVPEDLPILFGNETQIKIVFRNLIGNAVKFNNKPDPLVEVTFQNAENNYYLFTIKDNGIGIDKDFHDKIFVIFQRLHRREEYEGTGAGLAIVKKIIELHKGKIWVESELGKGSSFCFTLPKPYSQDS
jgi:PAS domain S-box-containing protein